VKIDFFISPAYRVQPLGEVEDDEGAGAAAVPGRIRLEIGGMQHSEAGPELRQLRRQRPDEHVAHEERVPGVRGDEAHRKPVGRVGPAEQILHEHLARVEVRADVLVQPLERHRVQPGVLLPPDAVARAGLLDHELVLGRPAGVGRGDRGERASVAQGALPPPERVLQQRRGGQVRVDSDGKEAVLDEGEALTLHCGGFGRFGRHTLPVRRPAP